MQKHANEQNYQVVLSPSALDDSRRLRFDAHKLSLPEGEIPYLHYHDCLEIGVCYGGNGLFLCDGRAESVGPGDIVLIFPYVHHYSRSIDAGELCYCRFAYFDHTALLRALLSAVTDETRPDLTVARGGTVRGIPPVLRSEEYPKAVELLHRLLESCFENGPYRDELAALRLSEFFLQAPAWFERFRFEHGTTSAETVRREEDPITMVAAYMSLHYAERISSATLSELCHLSESQLRRRFQRRYQMSPLGYLNRLRCKIGGELLRHTDLTVAAISDKVGYESASDFYRHFIATYNMSPSAFRKKEP
ncbi:MAG: helix-turn-helix transcriptional regulator [Clostridia bacterium]|nr:helix-turn-helix transcriptional regulator [Clostridia bacterium]